MNWVYDDGGRDSAGFRGRTGDCGVRALAIATGLPYREVYDKINEIAKLERRPKFRKPSNARTGVWPSTVKTFLDSLGWVWVPTMGIGTGTRVHLRADELPAGRIVARLSHHYAAVIDGVVHDLSDPSRDGTRAVYGYWHHV